MLCIAVRYPQNLDIECVQILHNELVRLAPIVAGAYRLALSSPLQVAAYSALLHSLYTGLTSDFALIMLKACSITVSIGLYYAPVAVSVYFTFRRPSNERNCFLQVARYLSTGRIVQLYGTLRNFSV